jgi:mono/diheme cytochrome c family protein
MSASLKAAFVAAGFAATTLGGTFTLASHMQRRQIVVTAAKAAQTPLTAERVAAGQHLFLMNCAHCHANDASGDEGPDLHGLLKTDSRIHDLISNGIKGEMPRFKSKLSESDIQALIAFLRSLN